MDAAYTLADQERMARAVNYFEWQSRMVLPHVGRRVVEIGCGIGNFTGRLLDRELVVAVDIEAVCIERLRARYAGHANLHVLVASEVEPLARFVPDSVVCLNVLEHMEDDRRALEEMAGILPGGGRVILIVPAFPALYGPIDGALGHHRRYTRAPLKRLAAECGLRVKQMRYMNLAGFFGWWMNAKVLKRGAQSEGQIELFDHYFVPLMERVEGLVAPPFGQSLFAVLEK